MSKSTLTTMDDSVLAQEEHELLDASGLLCPEPVMLLHNVIKKLPKGGLVKILATDSSTLRDIPRFCEHLGHQLLVSPSAEHPLSGGGDTPDTNALVDDQTSESKVTQKYIYWVKKKQ